MTQRFMVVVMLVGSMLACGSGEKSADADSAGPDAEAGQADASSGDGGAAGAADSIPMSVTITIPSATQQNGTIHGGTFRGEGNGARCEHLTDGGPVEWAVIYPGGDDLAGVGPVQLNVGKLAGGKTSQIFVMANAGSIEGMGSPRMPLTHHISTVSQGSQGAGAGTTMGSGTATVSREGERVRFEVDAVSGTTKQPFRMTVVCEREGKWV